MSKKDNLKTILKYIQVYTECDDYIMSKITLLFDLYPINNVEVRLVNKIIEVEKKIFVPTDEEMKEWTNKYLITNNITYEQLTVNNRKYESVKRRVHFSKEAREYGFNLTEIGKSLKMHHSSIIHYLYDFKQ